MEKVLRVRLIKSISFTQENNLKDMQVAKKLLIGKNWIMVKFVSKNIKKVKAETKFFLLSLDVGYFNILKD